MIVIPFASLIILLLTPWLSFPFVQFWDITWSLLAMSSATLFWKTRNNGLLWTKGNFKKMWGKLCVNYVPKSTKINVFKGEPKRAFATWQLFKGWIVLYTSYRYITIQQSRCYFLWLRASEGMHEVRSVKKIMPVCTSLFIPLVKNLRGSLRIFKDLWRSAKTCKRPLKIRIFKRSLKIFTW